MTSTSSQVTARRARSTPDAARPWMPPVFTARAQAMPEPTDPAAVARVEAEARERGYAEGLQLGRDAIATRVATLDALLAALAEPLAQQRDVVANAIRQAAWTLGELLARDHLRHSPEAVARLVRESITALAAPEQPLVIRVSPAQRDAIQAALEQQAPARAWPVESDPSLADGDCKVGTPHATADATLDARLRLLGEQLLEASGDTGLDSREH